MTEGGTSKKVTVVASGVAALLALAAQDNHDMLSFFVAVGITIVTLSAIGVQALLDYKK
jgi:hypothetical protein